MMGCEDHVCLHSQLIATGRGEGNRDEYVVYREGAVVEPDAQPVTMTNHGLALLTLHGR